MKLLSNSTKIFIETLERTALKRAANGDVTVLDEGLYKVYQLYKTGKIKFQDHVIEIAAVVAGQTSVDFVKESLAKVIGVRNLGNAKLNENEFFCPTAIQMLGVEGLAGVTDADLQSAEYGPIDTLNAVTNGWLDVKVNETEYLLRELPTGRFTQLNGGGTQDAPKGMVFLDNTTIMKPQYRNEIILKTGVAMGAATAVKFLIYGTRTTPVGN